MRPLIFKNLFNGNGLENVSLYISYFSLYFFSEIFSGNFICEKNKTCMLLAIVFTDWACN